MFKDVYAPQSWYEPDEADPYDDYECKDCSRKKDKLEESAKCFKAVIEILYGNQEIDFALLEKNLDAICDELDVNPIIGFLNIRRK